MPLRRATCILLMLLLAPLWSLAQPTTEALREVRIEGTTGYADIVRVVLEARAGTPVDQIDLEAERNRIYALGTFSEVSLRIEEEAGGPVLVVRAQENPLISEVAFEGNASLPTTALREAVAQEQLLAGGRVFNTSRAEDARETISRVYRQIGFPFDVAVTLDVQEVSTEAGVRVRLVYEIDETPPVESVTVGESQILSEAQLREPFAPLLAEGEFSFEAYRQALQAVEELYRERGYRGSGVDVAATTLQQGELHVSLREARIASIDSSAVGVEPEELSLQVGDLFNYDLLLEDVRALAQGRTGDIRLVTSATATGDLRVRFELGPPETAGPIDEIVFEGNTLYSDSRLREELTLQEGDTFTSTLALEDFGRILALYADAGYLVLDEPDFGYEDGTYVQRIREVRIADVIATFEDEQPRTQAFVVTRYMPETGSVFNQNEVRSSLQRIARLGAVEPVTANLVPTEEPDEVILEVVVRETRTGTFTPSAQYATDSGFSASVSFSESNFLGRAHNVSAEVNAQTSDLGLQLGGRVSYNIPWLYIDALDFQEVPTSVSASAFSTVITNRPLTSEGATRIAHPDAPAGEENMVQVGEYAQRDTGLSFSVGRPIADFTSLRFSARGSVTRYVLEPPRAECEFDEAGNIENANACALPEEYAREFLPQGGLSSYISTTVNFDNRDNPDFPRRGVAASGSVGLGLGTDFRNPETGEQQGYNYQQVELGARTYLLLSDIAPEIDDPNHVLAFRVNLGHQFGGEYPVSRRFLVGKSTNEATAIRGYQAGDFSLSRTYATGSVEYRYDFGLDTFATQTVIGIVFADIGYASHVPGFDPYGAPLFAGYGVGVQLNLGFGGVVLPALRFDYGFSQRNPGGEFRFRVGPVF